MSAHSDSEADFRPIKELVERLGLPVKNLRLFVRAFTHRSYVNENQFAQQDNERLEFLGDAVLDFVVGAWVYHHFPEMAEGDLTRLRSALVRTDQLAAFARRLDFGPALRLGRGEFASGGRNRDSLLCGSFEAFIGALFIETDVHTAERFMEPLLESAREAIFSSPDLSDHKSRFQEWSQGDHIGSPVYVLVDTSGPDHQREFEVELRVNGKVYGRGRGPSKAAAEQAAAREALKTLGME